MQSIFLITAYVTGVFTSYLTGAVIALFLLAYLIYSLVKPEKF